MELAPLILMSIPAIHAVRKSLETAERLPEWDKILSKIWIVSIALFLLAQMPYLGFIGDWYGELIYIVLLITVFLLRDYRPAWQFSVALLPYAAVYVVNKLIALLAPSFFEANDGYFETAQSFAFLWLVGFGIYAFIQNNKEVKQRKKAEEKARLEAAKKAELEHLVVERTTELTQQKEELEKTLDELKAAQTQLIHSEKMASLGELTAGIAHEIQNPLNFVNNFSELSVELAHELIDEIEKPVPDKGLVKDLVKDLSQNQEKINHHGKRAANIVSGMLQHARSSTGKKEPTDLNELADEYLRLAYHGLRAKDKEFNAKMVTNFDPAIGKIEVVPQDMGRVFLNLINNAFYAVTQKKRSIAQDNPTAAAYEPTVTVSTRLITPPSSGGLREVEIRIRDNGTGIPDSLKAKIFQPFFTTKPTGQGTGLGLSLAYDIVTKGHGGTMEVESAEGRGTTFVIKL